MKMKVWVILLIFMYLTFFAETNIKKYQIIMDDDTAEKANWIIGADIIFSSGEEHGKVIGKVSSFFLGVPYQSNTLVGGLSIPEALVANFNGVDCFTLVDYVEALARSRDQKSFLHNLSTIRYTGGNVNYLSRRHFFSDWFATTPHNAWDVTPDISPKYVVAYKKLNRKPDGNEYIVGLGIRFRKVNYIPRIAINQQVVSNLKTGDYVGIYSFLEGLDVSHVGIVVHHDDQVWFRNASSLVENRKVVDLPFLEYMHSKPGIIVLRAK